MSDAVELSESIDIEPKQDLARRVSSSLGLSASPPWIRNTPQLTRTTTASTKQLKPFATEDIKILLLENVNKTGVDLLKAQGYQVDFRKSSLPEDELIEQIRWVTQLRTDTLSRPGQTPFDRLLKIIPGS